MTITSGVAGPAVGLTVVTCGRTPGEGFSEGAVVAPGAGVGAVAPVVPGTIVVLS